MKSADRRQLKDIMLKRYLRLGESHTLSEVMGFLTDERFEAEGLPYLVVVGKDGSLAGMLSSKAVFKAIMEGVAAGKSNESAFFHEVAARLNKTTGEVMNRDVPSLPATAFLEEAFIAIRDTGSEVIAVLEDNRVIGLVTARILFETAATLTVGSLSGGVIPPA